MVKCANLRALVYASSLITTSVYSGPVVPDALHLSFSPRGQEYFRENLNAVLLANELDLSKTKWEEIKFAVNKPFDGFLVDERTPEGFRTLRSQLAAFFNGFPINPPRLEVKLASSELNVKFKSMSAQVDPAGPAAYGMLCSKGVVVFMRLEADGLRFTRARSRSS